MKSVKQIKDDLKKIEQVIIEAKQDLDKRKNYDEAIRFLCGIKETLETLRKSS